MAAVFLGAGWASAQPAPPPGAPAPPPRPIPLTAPAPPGSPAPGVLAAPPGPVAPATTGPVLTTGQPAPVLSGPVPAGPAGPTALPAGAFDPAIMGYQFWANGDYLLWRLRNQHIPPAAQVLPVGVLAVNITDQFVNTPNGVPTPGDTTVFGFAPLSIQSNAVFAGGNTVDPGEHSGGRFSAGFWVDPEQTFGLETSFFFLDRRGSSFGTTTANSVDQFIINTGFTQNLFLLSGSPPTQSLLNSFPVILVRQTSSAISGTASSALWGGELNARCTALQFGRLTLGGLAGFRYIDLHEDLAIANSVRLFRPANPNLRPISDPIVNPPVPADLSFNTLDSVRTYNHYYGGQVGVDLSAMFGGFFVAVRSKIGVGDMHQVVNIAGTTTVINNDPTSNIPSTTSPGGLLSGPLDQGKHSRDRIAFNAETTVKLGYQFTNWLRGYVGYDILYLSQTARPSDQTSITTLSTTTTIAGSTNNVNVAGPTFRFHDSEFWAQGVTFGLELRY